MSDPEASTNVDAAADAYDIIDNVTRIMLHMERHRVGIDSLTIVSITSQTNSKRKNENGKFHT